MGRIDVSNCAVVYSAFDPEEENLENMLFLARNGINTIVVDNSLDERIRILEGDLPIVYRKNRNIGGIARALNIGVALAKEKHLQYVIFMDQDSEIDLSAINSLLKVYAEEELKCENLIVAAAYYDKNLGVMGGSCRLTKFGFEKVNDYDRNGLAEVSILITAGTCLGINVFDYIGGFDERLIIDDVDTEYCLRAASKNVKLLLTNRSIILHAIGMKEKRKFLGILQVKPNNQSATRRYYIFRNNVTTIKRYGLKYPGFVVLSVARLIHEMICMVFYEKNKYLKIRKSLLGLFHGVVGRLGAL